MLRALMNLMALASLIGCAFLNTWDDVMGSWVGAPITRIENLWGPPDKTQTRADGNTIYKYHLEDLDPTCVHYWVVNPEGTIVDFYYKGYCRPVG